MRRLRQLSVFSFAALATCLAVSVARADELVLKNGKKVVGTIVGYEHDMFRVETDYGVALVRKDKVATIKVTSSDDAAGKSGKEDSTTAKPDARAGAVKEAAGNVEKKSSEAPLPATNKLEEAAPSRSVPAVAATPPSPAASTQPVTTPRPSSSPAPKPAPTPVSHVIDEPLPAHLQEHVEGSTYVNDTFQFSMFKPLSWKVYEEVPQETGSGIAAVGADDEQTLLVVDRQVWSGPPDLKSDEIEARLRRTYQEYQKLSEEPRQFDGQPAVRRTFKGVLDGVEWHGISVQVSRANTVFGIIGLTSAETFEFHQAVLNKIINSFHFLSPLSTKPTATTP